MQNKEYINKKSFIIKLIFFIMILSITLLLYFESTSIMDIVYFIVVFIMLIRYLYIKLYH